VRALAGSFAGMSHTSAVPGFERAPAHRENGMTEDGPGHDPRLPEDARLASLDERLKRAQADEAERTGRNRKPADSNERLGNRVLSTLIGGMFGGAAIGWALDQLFDTSPWLLLGMLFLGTAAGFWNIIKISSQGP
jgi:ATP synthase protein I